MGQTESPYKTRWDEDPTETLQDWVGCRFKMGPNKIVGMWLQQRPYRTGWDVDPTETFQENTLEPLQDWLEWLLLPHAHILS